MSVLRDCKSSLARSARPTRPFLPFFPFSSGMHDLVYGTGRERPRFSHVQKRASVVEVARLALGPGEQLGDINDDLSVGRQFQLGPVHGTRRRTLEVNSFAVVAAAVARTLEFILARLPVGGAAQVRAASINHEQAVGGAINPDTVFLLPLRVDAESVVRRIANLERSARFKKSAGQKEAEECNEPCAEEGCDTYPGKPAAAGVDGSVFGADRGHPTCGGGLGCPYGGRGPQPPLVWS